MREIRLDFMVKLYFLLEDDPPRARDLISAQIEACTAYVKEVEHEADGLDPASFDAMALGSKLSAAKLTRSWLQDCRRNLERLARSTPDRHNLARGRTAVTVDTLLSVEEARERILAVMTRLPAEEKPLARRWVRCWPRTWSRR